MWNHHPATMWLYNSLVIIAGSRRGKLQAIWAGSVVWWWQDCTSFGNKLFRTAPGWKYFLLKSVVSFNLLRVQISWFQQIHQNPHVLHSSGGAIMLHGTVQLARWKLLTKRKTSTMPCPHKVRMWWAHMVSPSQLFYPWDETWPNKISCLIVLLIS